MIALAFAIVLLGVILLWLCLYFDRRNKNIDTVVYSPLDPENDEAQIRQLLFIYPRAVIIVPKSNINFQLVKDNKRVIIQ